MQKTAKEWFSEFPEPYRTQALENLESQKFISASDALMFGFDWDENKGDSTYWETFYNQLLSEGK